MSLRRLIPWLCAAVALPAAGCGSADAPRSSTEAAPGPAVDVVATDGRIGDATFADARGLRRLERAERRPDTAVRGPRKRHGVGAGADCPDVDAVPSPETLSVVEAATLCLINGERADAGLPTLVPNEALARAAISHSTAMIEHQFFAHEGISGDTVVDRVRSAGYLSPDAAWMVGENLAWGTGTLATPRSIVAAWMNSAGHRENILRAGYRELGQGILLGNPRSTDGSGATYSMTFGQVERESSTPVSRTATPAEPAGEKRRSSRKARRAARRSARRASVRRARRARARRAAARRARVGRPIARRALAPDAR